MERKIIFWIKTTDEKFFHDFFDIDVLPYLDDELTGILTGRIIDASLLSRLYGNFVLGRRRYWITQDEDSKINERVVPFVRVRNNFRYEKGFILTANPAETNERYCLRYMAAIRKQRIPVVYLEGSRNENLILRVFRTYSGLVEEKRKLSLFLYKVERR